jgi:hypothetical protein
MELEPVKIGSISRLRARRSGSHAQGEAISPYIYPMHYRRSWFANVIRIAKSYKKDIFQAPHMRDALASNKRFTRQGNI